MQTEKKTFTKAEAEVIRFEKTDVITTSPTCPKFVLTDIVVSGESAQGCPLYEDD